MKAPLLSELREPPIIGRFYMVPIVLNYPWHGRVADWPVLGPLHEDREFFGFTNPHYHVDIRFLSERAFRFAVRKLRVPYSSGKDDLDAALNASAAPLCTHGHQLPRGRPELRRLRCKRVGVGSPLLVHADTARAAMEARYGSPAEPLRLADGRLLCPHRKVDLSQFPPDEQGIVICPLHGLRVRCGASA